MIDQTTHSQRTRVHFVVQSNNSFSGPIPSPVGMQIATRNLASLLLNNNRLNGTIPPELLRDLSDTLVRVDISNNNLTGTIPTVIGKMHKLERIDAQNNLLEGSLPAEMNRMYPDVHLNLTNNL